MATYSCPKHTDVILNQPGSCPKCGSRLEPHSPDPSQTTSRPNKQQPGAR